MIDDASKPFCEPGTPQRWSRPRRVRVTHVDLEVTIDLDAGSVEGEVRHRCEPCDDSAEAIVLDQHGLTILAVSADGAPADTTQDDEHLTVRLPRPGTACTVAVRFRCVRPAKGIFFIAPTASPGDGRPGRVQMCWTQGAMEDHSWWFPCFDTPNNLSTYRVAIRHRSTLLAASGGVRESLETSDGWSTTTYRQERAHVLYLLTVVVGDFARVPQDGGALPIEHLVPSGCEAQGRAMFRATRPAIRLLEAAIGVAYPWQCYGHAVVHGFMWGGMENTTLTTITDRMLMTAEDQAREDIDCDRLVVHELVHQWFGDLLTMKSWSDIWLNESFATYYEAVVAARYAAERAAAGGDGSVAVNAEDELALYLWGNRAEYLEEDRGRYRRPLVTNRYADAYELFDRVAYEKGSLVLHHLASLLGEQRFQAVVKLYVSRHAHDLVETADVRQAIEDATGEPFDWFFAQWMERAGHPQLAVSWAVDSVRQQLRVTVEQTQATGASLAEVTDKLYRLPTTLRWCDASGVRNQAVTLARTPEVVVLPCQGAVSWVAIDPDGSLPATWQEQEGEASLLTRLADTAAGTQARARAAVALGGKLPTPTLIAGLITQVRASAAPRLVRNSAIAALGELHAEPARDALLGLLVDARQLLPGRQRRLLARALARQRGLPGNALLGEALMAAAEAESSLWCAGEYLLARAALELGGATPLLRARLGRASWQDVYRVLLVRALGQSGEAAAIDEVAGLLSQAEASDQLVVAACEAGGALGQRHVLARPRLRQALEQRLDAPALSVRAASARALATLGDPAAAGALATRLRREIFGNVARVLRESQTKLGQVQAQLASLGELMRRLDEGDQERQRLMLRIEALEKRLESGPH